MLKSPLLKKYCGSKGPAFEGANSKNSSCWKGWKKVGEKKSPSGTGEIVNDCEKIK
jgi:hypothetical protein